MRLESQIIIIISQRRILVREDFSIPQIFESVKLKLFNPHIDLEQNNLLVELIFVSPANGIDSAHGITRINFPKLDAIDK